MSKEDTYKHGMQVPENYFEEFEDRLFIRLAEEELPDSPGFTVPDGYFDTLEQQVMDSLEQDSKVPVIPLYRRKVFTYAASIAACAILVVALFFGDGPENTALDLAEIEAYLDDGGFDYSSYDVAQLLDDEELENLPLSDELISEETLEAYLLENLDDTNLLIE